eukprot:9036051-Pyramimonas_sp.AAC.1
MQLYNVGSCTPYPLLPPPPRPPPPLQCFLHPLTALIRLLFAGTMRMQPALGWALDGDDDG